MFLVKSKAGAIACMLLSLLLLGTWPAILTLLERRGSLPQHTYLDYSITNFLAAVVIALTFDQIGDSKPNMPNFITQLSQDTSPCVLMSMLGGLFLSLGNVSIQYAWPFVGVSVAQAMLMARLVRIAVVIGTSLNYYLDKINKASILFPGVACCLTADILEDIEVGDLNAEETKKAGTAESIIAVENQRAIKVYTNLEGNRSNLVQTSWAILSIIKAVQGTVWIRSPLNGDETIDQFTIGRW